jgi:hypothetical protein
MWHILFGSIFNGMQSHVIYLIGGVTGKIALILLLQLRQQPFMAITASNGAMRFTT